MVLRMLTNSTRVYISFTNETLALIDSVRGSVPRSEFILQND